MKKTMVSRTLSVHKEHELLLKLETAGLSGELAQRVIDSKGNDLAIKVVRLIQKCAKATTSQKCAREIMGKNMFGIEEAIKYFGVNPTRQQLAVLSEIPFSRAVLEKVKNTHVLVAVFPLSILEIRRKVEAEIKLRLFYPYSWYKSNESFAEKRGRVNWQLVCKTPQFGLRNWKEQKDLLGKDNVVPTAQLMVYTIISHYLATGERLFGHTYVRTSSVRSGGRGCRIIVGSFDLEGLAIDDCAGWNDTVPYNNLGVSSARRKF